MGEPMTASVISQEQPRNSNSMVNNGAPAENRGSVLQPAAAQQPAFADNSPAATSASSGGQVDLCPLHKRKIEIICIDCKERICSNCALFGNHKPHDIRMEQDVLDEINLRTECLMEMF